MKITHVIPALTKGGAERVVVDLANAAVEAGDEVTIIAAKPTPPQFIAHLLSGEVKLVYIASGPLPQAYLRMPHWLYCNRRWLFEQDVVHCHLTFGSVFGSALQQMRSMFNRTRPVVVETYHAVGMAIPRWTRALHAFLLTGRDAVALMADDPYWAGYASRHRKTIFRTIPNGIASPGKPSIDACEAYRRELGEIPPDARVVGTVSRLVPARRPDLLLEAFRHVARVLGPRVHMLVAGEGSERPGLERMAREWGIAAQVHMPGLALRPVDPMSLMDLFVTVNVGSITGIAALEAAFLGVPIIAVQLQHGYRPGSRDWIWSSVNVAEVGQKAAELLSDDAALRELGWRQQRIARTLFSIDAMKQAYDEFYSAARNRRAGRGRTTCR